MVAVRQQRYFLIPGLVLATWAVLCLVGLNYPLGSGLPDEILDYAGIVIVMAGAILGRAPQEVAPASWSWLWASELWLVCSGAALLAGRWDISLLLASAGCARVLGVRRKQPERLSLGARVAEAWRVDGSLIIITLAVLLLLAAMRDALAEGGPKEHRLELGTCGMLLAVLGVAWAGREDGLRALSAPLADAFRTRGITPGQWLTFAAVPLTGFLLLGCLVRLPQVQALDTAFVHLVHNAGDQALRKLMRAISNAGGEDLALIWLPVLSVGLLILRRARSLRFFLASNFAVFGIETIFKTLTFRARPDLTRGAHFDSFPSGHTLSAVILTGTLLLILWPSVKHRAGRWLLTVAAVGWPLLMGASRVYLGRHFLTDVLGSLLLGVAWVLASAAILQALEQPSTSPESASEQIMPLPA